MAKSRAIRNEYSGADLGDERRNRRLLELGEALGLMPEKSLPLALGTEAALEGAYRFLSNEEVSAAAILQPHFRETALRCAAQTVVIAHDTTDFVFSGARAGLGRMRGNVERGFFAHTALAVSTDGNRDPLGTLHLETWTRGEAKKPQKNPGQRHLDMTRESLRWWRGVEAVEAQLVAGQAIHVMDREADSYDLFVSLLKKNVRFVLRSKSDRRVAQAKRLSDVVSHRDVVLSREVPISKRQSSPLPRAKQSHPSRSARTALLQITAGCAEVLRPRSLPATLPPSIKLNVVEVSEENPPAGEAPIYWRLLTSESIATLDDIERIVDHYRGRWRIEEFYKALKTGCAIEKRQLESMHALENLLATFVPIAWFVLRLRSLAAVAGAEPATRLLSALQIKILRHTYKHSSQSPFLINHALLAVAALGGHLKRNGAPGWQVLARGFERLQNLTLGAVLAQEM